MIDLAEPGINTYGKPIKKWLCKCDCGNQSITTTARLLSEKTKSCGCLQKETTSKKLKKHGLRFTKEYRIWAHMKNRCNNKNYKKFHLWGGRGIKVCKEWENDFPKFLSDMGKCPDGMSIDRIDNNKGYSKENCRWATSLEQSNNTRSNNIFYIENEKLTLTQLAEKWKCSRNSLKMRIKRGATIQDLIKLYG